MPSVWLPGQIAETILNEKAGFDEAKRVMGVRQALKSIDPRLDLFLCKQEDPENELKLGFWYVWRRNDDGTIAMWEVRTPDGGFREPDEQVLEAFRRMDRETIWDFKDEQERKRRQRARDAERQREQTAQNLKDWCDFTFRTQVPVTDGLPKNRAERRKKA